MTVRVDDSSTIQDTIRGRFGHDLRALNHTESHFDSDRLTFQRDLDTIQSIVTTELYYNQLYLIIKLTVYLLLSYIISATMAPLFHFSCKAAHSNVSEIYSFHGLNKLRNVNHWQVCMNSRPFVLIVVNMSSKEAQKKEPRRSSTGAGYTAVTV